LDTIDQSKLWSLFHRSQISLSITTHDGTPNTLIEAMACNCFPIAGDIDSIREWIVPGVNGLLVDPHNPQGLTDAILLALSQTKLRDNARIYNQELIKSKAEIEIVEKLLSNYYSIFLTNRIS
jgi:glycosyltransferase involved in cell wall biosynthesis